jgi:hypothetical protein
MKLLKFGQGNAKLDRFTDTFSLPAGWTCPGALYCHSQVERVSGKLVDGKDCQFRCMSAFAETLYPNVRRYRWANFDLIRTCKSSKQTAELVAASLPKSPVKVRHGVAGDFFNQRYFDAWLSVAREYPKALFYGYTKSIPLWLNRLKEMPKNFRLTASYGGKWDHLIRPAGLKSAIVVYSTKEAEALKLEIDHDDSHAYDGKKSFALLLHSMQPAKSIAGEAYQKLRELGIAGYYTNKARRTAMGAVPSRVGLAKRKICDNISLGQ